MVLAVAGFGITITQLVRVKTALASRAQRSAGEMLLASVRDLERVERDLRSAAVSGKHELARSSLLDWRNQAADVHALLSLVEREHEALARPLELSLGMVGAALGGLDDGRASLPALLGPLLVEMSSTVVAGRAVVVGMMVVKEGSA